MEAKRKEELLHKYQHGKIKQAELEELFDWYNQTASEQVPLDAQEVQFRLNRIAQQLPILNTSQNVSAPIRKLWIKWTAAAVLLGAIGLSLWQLKTVERQGPEKVLTNIQPVKNAQPIWTNKQGQRIDLAQLAVKDTLKTNGLLIFKDKAGFLIYRPVAAATANNDIQTIQTPAGSNIKLILADGTKVWLNSASTLRFFGNMDQNERQVELQGEAYFEVTKQVNEQGQRKHFLVRSEHQTVEVLGTKFNIKNYQEDPFSTTSLYEGSIRLETNQLDRSASKSVLLKPGQQSILNKHSQQLDFKNLLDIEQQSWREGYFNFDGESIQSVCQQLSRWYPVDFEIDPHIPAGEYHGSISKSYSLNEVLDILTKNKLDVEFKNRNDQIIVRLKQK